MIKMRREIKRIVCMTEESVEFLHAIGRSDLIAGVSVFAKRPEAVKNHPVISSFTHANINKIKNLNPDLVIGFSDIQKDIARDLIDAGVDVYISNQRSIEEIFRYLQTLGNMIGEREKTQDCLEKWESKLQEAFLFGQSLNKRPKVYIEEWDEPQICGIRWFSELVELCGGIDIFKEKSQLGKSAKERFVTDQAVAEANPDIILASWCGKPVDFASFEKRPHLQLTKAMLNKRLYELAPEVFLQPGPALFVDGIDQLRDLFTLYNED